MNPDLVRRAAKQIKPLDKEKLFLIQGVVLSVSGNKLVVQLADNSVIPNVRFIGNRPNADETVWILHNGPTLIVLGGLYDNTKTSFLGAKVTRLTNQSITNAAANPLSPTTELYDYGGFWNSSFPNTFTIPSDLPGLYRVSSRVAFAANAGGTYRQLVIKRNGNIVVMDEPSITANRTVAHAETVELCDGGDIFTFEAQQNSGASLNIEGTVYFYLMEIEKVG